jgi:hypothetical protein
MHMDAEGVRGFGLHFPLRDTSLEFGIAEDFVVHGAALQALEARLVLARQPGPEHDAVGPRLPAGNAQREGIGTPARRRLRERGPHRRPAAQGEPQRGAVQISTAKIHWFFKGKRTSQRRL